ncbi:MAG: primosomal protein N' [Dehalococcoidia bacterium]|nr:primosomal protein N' [Dehalococcoidia bacterium]
MKYAEVAVNSPATHRTYCYAIPEHLKVKPGQAVWVPFGSRTIQGIVVELNEQPSVETVKELSGVTGLLPLLTPAQLELARWMSKRYFSPLFECLALMFPPNFQHRFTTYLQTTRIQPGQPSLTPEEKNALAFINGGNKVSLHALEKKFGTHRASQLIASLLQDGLVTKTCELKPPRAKPKSCTYLKLERESNEIDAEINKLNKSRAFKQAELLSFLDKQDRSISIKEAQKCVNCSPKSIRSLEQRGLISMESINVRRDPLARLTIAHATPPPLTPSQEIACKSIEEKLQNGRNDPSPIFLLFGVTGSGKTELYLQALSRIVSLGKRGICLIPEIALTTQMVERFASRFPGRVAILHSKLSPGEQLDEWQRIQEGRCDVVIGPRSALFSPQPNLGLIIIDEEHEWTYKQEDKSPRYHSRDVALKLAELHGAAVILGSATPDIDSFHRAQQGKYHLLTMKERITSRGYSPLPQVSIVDLKEELKRGNTNLLSDSLASAIREALEREEQVILFLNRRGATTFVQCRRCHFVFRCPRCSIALTCHAVEGKLFCHRCNYSIPVPSACPRCSSTNLNFLGVGTQRVEEEVKCLFPEARILRWDKDTVTRRYAQEELLRDFREHKADILIGTQMIAKGLDLPQVTVAGIIMADTGLNFPDFRAGERTFQLLCQVAGRAGRGPRGGKAIIQTYAPENYVIQFAAKHDYPGFYQQEMNYRQQYNYPPFSHLVRLIYTHSSNSRCQLAAERMRQMVLKEKGSQAMNDLGLIGPLPAFNARVRGKYRWQLLLRGDDPSRILQKLTLPQGWTIDVDPIGLS